MMVLRWIVAILVLGAVSALPTGPEDKYLRSLISEDVIAMLEEKKLSSESSENASVESPEHSSHESSEHSEYSIEKFATAESSEQNSETHKRQSRNLQEELLSPDTKLESVLDKLRAHAVRVRRAPQPQDDGCYCSAGMPAAGASPAGEAGDPLADYYDDDYEVTDNGASTPGTTNNDVGTGQNDAVTCVPPPAETNTNTGGNGITEPSEGVNGDGTNGVETVGPATQEESITPDNEPCPDLVPQLQEIKKIIIELLAELLAEQPADQPAEQPAEQPADNEELATAAVADWVDTHQPPYQLTDDDLNSPLARILCKACTVLAAAKCST